MTVRWGYPFLSSLASFGATAMLATIADAFYFSPSPLHSLLHSDDPYIWGPFAAFPPSMGSLLYLLTKELRIVWLKPKFIVAVFYGLLITYCFAIEALSRETMGHGYLFLIWMALTFPGFLIVARYRLNGWLLALGIACGILYGVGYLNVDLV